MLVSPVIGAALEGFRIPTAILIGTKDAALPRDAAAQLRKIRPRANVVLVYGAGADTADERPEAVADVAGDFLDRQARFAFMTKSLALTP